MTAARARVADWEQKPGVGHTRAAQMPRASCGWLIFAGPPAELAAHRAVGQPHHEVYLMCDDIYATVAELAAKGAEFTDGVVELAWGLSTTLKLPGGGQILLDQPSHPGPLIP